MEAPKLDGGQDQWVWFFEGILVIWVYKAHEVPHQTIISVPLLMKAG